MRPTLINCIGKKELMKRFRRVSNHGFMFHSEPLTQEQIAVLKQMLQELHGAGLDWDHPFTQCRMQNAIFAMRNMINMERDACVNLAPPPIVPKFLDPTNPLAFVRFTQPVNDFADEYFYPLSKKSKG
jgi:receptor-type tyrosine-protein phosphatase N